MTLHLGNIPASSTLYIPFQSFDANGASVTITGLATSDIQIYKNGSTTQRSSTAGFTLLDTDGIDFDGITGLHGFSIDLSDNTDAGFFSVGAFYWVVVSTVTISSQTVNFIAATFRIVAAEAVTGKPKVDVDAWLGTAASTPTVAGVPNVNVKTWNDLTTVALPLVPTTAGRTLDVSAGGEAGVDWANVGSPTTTVGLSGTTVKTATDVATATTDIQARLPAALVSGRIDASVGAMAANVMTAAAAAADLTTELQSGLSTLNAADVRTAVGLASANLDTQLSTIAGYIDTEVAAILAAVDTEVAAIKAKTDNLPAAPAAVGDIPTAIQNADALLDRSAGVETGLTPRQYMRLSSSVLFGKSSGLDTATAIYRDFGDSKNRITASVDGNGNRASVSRDAT